MWVGVEGAGGAVRGLGEADWQAGTAQAALHLLGRVNEPLQHAAQQHARREVHVRGQVEDILPRQVAAGGGRGRARDAWSCGQGQGRGAHRSK
jgi:hypothetical protein